jgi:HD-GYP domain-containing protein (c-di-GMP phosphodiesterase class II)
LAFHAPRSPLVPHIPGSVRGDPLPSGFGPVALARARRVPTRGRATGDDHHERLNGSGYRRGLYAHHLDVETRILAVCDVFDALISTRVYREAWSEESALALLRDKSGTEFDPQCVAALERVLDAERVRAPVARFAGVA